MEQISDAELVVRARDRGDGVALDELLRRHRDTAYRVALRICLNPAEAEDIAQESLVRAWRSLDRFRSDAAFSTWLYRITTNTALKRAGRRKDVVMAELPEPLGPDLDPAGRVVQRERLAVATTALASLPPQQRACWVLREVEGLSYDELAEVLGLTLAAVKGRLFRARAEVTAALARYDEDTATEDTPTEDTPTEKPPSKDLP